MMGSAAAMATRERSVANATTAGERGTFARFRQSVFTTRQGWLAGGLFLIVCCTRGYFLGDTNSYVSTITGHFGKSPVGPANVLWEFGHLLWRPLGWMVVQLAAPTLIPLTSWEPARICSLALVGMSMIFGFLTVLLWHSMALEIVTSRAIAFLIAAGFACANSFLTYIHSGTPYVPGLFFVTLALWIVRGGGPNVTPHRIAASAIAAALAALLWFPYVLSTPGILLSVLWPQPRTTSPAISARPVRLLNRFILVFSLCLIGVLGIGAWARRLHSVSETRSWLEYSQHRWAQTERVTRLATGIPRSFLYLGDDAILYRRFLRKDPYAPVSLRDVFLGSIWKILACALFGACLLYQLLRRSTGFWAFTLLAVGSFPVLLFAVLLFEPTSPERYFPAFPFLVIAIAWCLRDFPASHRATQSGLVAFLACMILTNVASVNRWWMDREDAKSLARVAPIAARHKPNDLIAVITFQDDLLLACNRSLFSPVNRPLPLQPYDVLRFATADLPVWREKFAERAASAWANGGDVWVSKRAWQEKPRSEWNWVENEDRRVSWRQVVEFFRALETDGDVGGPDGFFHLPASTTNKMRLGHHRVGALGRQPLAAMRRGEPPTNFD